MLWLSGIHRLKISAITAMEEEVGTSHRLVRTIMRDRLNRTSRTKCFSHRLPREIEQDYLLQIVWDSKIWDSPNSSHPSNICMMSQQCRRVLHVMVVQVTTSMRTWQIPLVQRRLSRIHQLVVVEWNKLQFPMVVVVWAVGLLTSAMNSVSKLPSISLKLVHSWSSVTPVKGSSMRKLLKDTAKSA